MFLGDIKLSCDCWKDNKGKICSKGREEMKAHCAPLSVPQWALPMLLWARSSEPCEPAKEACLKMLCLKAAFLLVLASKHKASQWLVWRLQWNTITQAVYINLYKYIILRKLDRHAGHTISADCNFMCCVSMTWAGSYMDIIMHMYEKMFACVLCWKCKRIISMSRLNNTVMAKVASPLCVSSSKMFLRSSPALIACRSG